MSRPKLALLLLAFAFSIPMANTVLAREPGWRNEVIARGAERRRIRSMHIIHRPYRPLHFYGNSIRRSYYRGVLRPTSQDVRRGFGALMSR